MDDDDFALFHSHGASSYELLPWWRLGLVGGRIAGLDWTGLGILHAYGDGLVYLDGP